MIDVQEKLFPFMHDKDALLNRIQILIEGLKVLNVSLLTTEQYTKGLGTTLPSIIQANPSLQALEKMSFSCCDDDTILKTLATFGKKNIILFGIEAHICVLQTALDLKAKGYMPVVVEDCISSRKSNDKDIAVKRMLHEDIMITTSESILFELTRYAGTDQFKGIARLIK